MSTPYLHIYASPMWHSEAFVLGNAEGLTALRDAIDRALAEGRGCASAFACDGEGFFTGVGRVDSNEVIDRLAVPYTDEIAQQRQRDDVIWPSQYPPARQAVQDAYAELDAKYGKKSDGN